MPLSLPLSATVSLPQIHMSWHSRNTAFSQRRANSNSHLAIFFSCRFLILADLRGRYFHHHNRAITVIVTLRDFSSILIKMSRAPHTTHKLFFVFFSLARENNCFPILSPDAFSSTVADVLSRRDRHRQLKAIFKTLSTSIQQIVNTVIELTSTVDSSLI